MSGILHGYFEKTANVDVCYFEYKEGLECLFMAKEFNIFDCINCIKKIIDNTQTKND